MDTKILIPIGIYLLLVIGHIITNKYIKRAAPIWVDKVISGFILGFGYITIMIIFVLNTDSIKDTLLIMIYAHAFGFIYWYWNKKVVDTRLLLLFGIFSYSTLLVLFRLINMHSLYPLNYGFLSVLLIGDILRIWKSEDTTALDFKSRLIGIVLLLVIVMLFPQPYKGLSKQEHMAVETLIRERTMSRSQIKEVGELTNTSDESIKRVYVETSDELIIFNYKYGAMKLEERGINDYRPIIFFSYRMNGLYSKGYVLGGYSSDKWVNTEDFELVHNGITVENEYIMDNNIESTEIDIDLVTGEEKYSIYSNDKRLLVKESLAKEVTINGYTLEEIIAVEFEPFESEDEFLMGINGDWEAVPRDETIDNGLYKVDIDGNGIMDEISLLKEPREDREYENSKDITLVANINGNNLDIEERFIDGDYEEDYGIHIIDLNGDGKFEIVRYITGHNTSVCAYELDNDDGFIKVLNYYNGD